MPLRNFSQLFLGLFCTLNLPCLRKNELKVDTPEHTAGHRREQPHSAPAEQPAWCPQQAEKGDKQAFIGGIMEIIGYNRKKAVVYAGQWAFSKNPQYYYFDEKCSRFLE